MPVALINAAIDESCELVVAHDIPRARAPSKANLLDVGPARQVRDAAKDRVETNQAPEMAVGESKLLIWLSDRAPSFFMRYVGKARQCHLTDPDKGTKELFPAHRSRDREDAANLMGEVRDTDARA